MAARSLNLLLADFCAAFKRLDETRPIGTSRRTGQPFQPGIGPLTEDEAVNGALALLKEENPSYYRTAGKKRYEGARATCDLVIPGEWAVEFKLVRPFGDNGKLAEHWAENLLHPYPGNVSALGDGLKLKGSSFQEEKAIMIFGYEHEPPKIDLDIIVRSFEMIARGVLGLGLEPAGDSKFGPLVHPHHKVGRIWAWRIA